MARGSGLLADLLSSFPSCLVMRPLAFLRYHSRKGTWSFPPPDFLESKAC